MKKKIDKSDRLVWADLVRVVAMWLVVLAHVSAGVMSRWGEISLNWWLGLDVYNSLARLGVPLFVMLSGALLLGKEEKIQVVLGRRIPRLVLPWLVWGTVDMVRYLWGNDLWIQPVWRFMYQWYAGNYWFMPMIVGLYLMLPIVRKFVANAKNIDLGYFMFWWFGVIVVLPFVTKVLPVGRVLPLPQSFEFLGYFVGGYWVTRIKWKRIWVWWALGLWLVGWLGVVVGTYRLAVMNGRHMADFFGYMNLAVVIAAFGCFVVVINLESVWQRLIVGRVRWLLEELSKVSFGVFLIHSMVIQTRLWGVTGWVFDFSSWLIVPVVTTLVFGVSSGVIWVLRKVPRLERFVS